MTRQTHTYTYSTYRTPPPPFTPPRLASPPPSIHQSHPILFRHFRYWVTQGRLAKTTPLHPPLYGLDVEEDDFPIPHNTIFNFLLSPFSFLLSPCILHHNPTGHLDLGDCFSGHGMTCRMVSVYLSTAITIIIQKHKAADLISAPPALNGPSSDQVSRENSTSTSTPRTPNVLIPLYFTLVVVLGLGHFGSHIIT